MLNDAEFDEILRDALAECYADKPDWQGEISPKYQRKFKKMLADPVKYAKRCRESYWQKARRYALRAAMILLVLGVGGFVFMPDLNVTASNLFTKLYNEYNSYRFAFQANEEDIVLPEIEINYIPEGYEIYYEHVNELKTRGVWKYRNTNEEIITIYVSSNIEELSKYNDNEYHEQQQVILVDGRRAVLLNRVDDNRSSILLWTDMKDRILFQVRGKVLETELIKIANDIKIKSE